MRSERVSIGDLLRLERRRIDPEPGTEYRSIGIYSWGKGIIENPPLLGAQLSKVSYYSIPSGALLLSNIQAWEAAIAVSTDRHHRNFIASQRFLPYVPRDIGVVDVRYLCHYLLSEPGMEKIRRASPGSIARNRTLGMKLFEAIDVPIVPIGSQGRIIEDLRDVEGFEIEERASGKRADAAVRALRDQILDDGISNSEWIPLRELLRLVSRETSIVVSDDYPMLGVRSFGRGAFKAGMLSGSETSYSKLQRVREDDVVYPKLMAWEGAFDVTSRSLDGRYVSPEFCTFEIDASRVCPRFLRHLLRWPAFVNRFSSAATGTNVRRRRLRPEVFLDSKAPLPSIATQLAIVERLEEVDRLGHLFERRSAIASSLVQSARNRLFRDL